MSVFCLDFVCRQFALRRLSCGLAGPLVEVDNLPTQYSSWPMATLTLVHIKVKPRHIAEFIFATQANRQESIKEPGNLRFDFLQDPGDETQFLLYEAYESAEAAGAHKATAHYQLWRDTVADMMEEPRYGQPMTVLGMD